jgi:methionyl-tRNA formyltransferase
MKNLPFIFFGTPDVASETLEIMYQKGLVPSLIITAPDRPSGRGMRMTPPPVKDFVIAHHIPYLQPEKITSEVLEEIEKFVHEHSIKIFIVVAYGKILPENLINIPEYGTYNIHYSLLPRWRGASPVEASILNGDDVTGVCIQRMIYELDAGDIVASSSLSVADDDTTSSLRAKLIPLGANLLCDIFPELPNIGSTGIQQDPAGITKCGKITKTDRLIDTTDTAPGNQVVMWRKYRAYDAHGGVYFMDNNIQVKVKHATFEKNKFIVRRVVYPGKPESSYL